MTPEFFLGSLIVVSAVIVIAAVAVFCRKMYAPGNQMPENTLEWISDLSVSRYEPMLRLLDERDFRFMREQPGFTPAMADRLRVQRYRIFVAYLRNLRSDFAGLTQVLKLVLAEAGNDRPELAQALFRAQLAFARGCALAYLSAFAWRLGLTTVNASCLLDIFESVHVELRCLAPQLTPA